LSLEARLEVSLPCPHSIVTIRSASHRDPSTSVGHGAALALLEHGAHVAIVSSSEEKLNAALKRIDHPNASGKVSDVRNEEQYTEVLKSLAPVDHLIYSSVDKIIRGAIADADLDDAKWYFGVKFWGSALTGKSMPKFHLPRRSLVDC